MEGRGRPLEQHLRSAEPAEEWMLQRSLQDRGVWEDKVRFVSQGDFWVKCGG